MGLLKTAYSTKGIVHFTVGAVIKKGDNYLLIDRSVFPEGWAGIAGHIEIRETPEEALIREVKEESNLKIKSYKMIFEETYYDNPCVMKANNHHWYVYECEIEGEAKKNGEAKSIGWYSKEEIKSMKLENTWERVFKKIGVL